MQTNFWKRVGLQTIDNIKLYFAAELKLLIFTILIHGLAFWSLHITNAWLIAVGISLVALLPVVGAGIVFIPWILIEWLQGDVQLGWWLFALYIGVEIAKEIIQPVLIGKDLKIPFWLPIVVTMLATMIFNLFGVIVASIIIPFIAAYQQVKAADKLQDNDKI